MSWKILKSRWSTGDESFKSSVIGVAESQADFGRLHISFFSTLPTQISAPRKDFSEKFAFLEFMDKLGKPIYEIYVEISKRTKKLVVVFDSLMEDVIREVIGEADDGVACQVFDEMPKVECEIYCYSCILLSRSRFHHLSQHQIEENSVVENEVAVAKSFEKIHSSKGKMRIVPPCFMAAYIAGEDRRIITDVLGVVKKKAVLEQNLLQTLVQ